MATLAAPNGTQRFAEAISSGRLNLLQIHELDLPGFHRQIQSRDGDRQGKASRAGAAGIYVENARLFALQIFVRVAADDDLETCGERIQIQSMHIVQNVDRNFAGLRYGGFGQFAAGPFFGVYVSTNSDNGSYFAELRQDVSVADVACVHDQFGAAQRGQRFFAQQTMRVGNQSDF